MSAPYPQVGPPGAYVPDHPRATTILVLGILGLVVCQVIAPVAWVMGNSTLAEIDRSGGRYGGRSQVNAGRICGIIGTALLVFGALTAVLALVIPVLVFGAALFSL